MDIYRELKIRCYPGFGHLPQEIPIHISSGYRCPKLNTLVGGAPNSQHKTGAAADIRIPDTTIGNQWFEWMEANLQFDQLIKERPNKTTKSFCIHVSFKRTGTNRQQVKFLTKNL